MLLTACTSSPPPPKISYIKPPQAYLTPCKRSQFNGKTYGDVVSYVVTLNSELKVCSERVDKIREWTNQKGDK